MPVANHPTNPLPSKLCSAGEQAQLNANDNFSMRLLEHFTHSDDQNDFDTVTMVLIMVVELMVVELVVVELVVVVIMLVIMLVITVVKLVNMTECKAANPTELNNFQQMDK